MVVDSRSAHIMNVHLPHVRLEFLPPNNMPLLQRLNQGIMKSVEAEFRKSLVQGLIINLRKSQNSSSGGNAHGSLVDLEVVHNQQLLAKSRPNEGACAT